MSRFLIGVVLLALVVSAHSIDVSTHINEAGRETRLRSRRLSGHLARIRELSSNKDVVDHETRAMALVDMRDELAVKGNWTEAVKSLYEKVKAAKTPSEHDVEYAVYIITNFLQITLSVVGILALIGAVAIAPPILAFIAVPLAAMAWFSGIAADKAELAIIAVNIRNVMNQVNLQLVDMIINQELIMAKGKKLATIDTAKESVETFLGLLETKMSKEEELTKKAREKLSVVILTQKNVQDQMHKLGWIASVTKSEDYKKLAETSKQLDGEIGDLSAEIASLQVNAHKVVEIKLGLMQAEEQMSALSSKMTGIREKMGDIYCKARNHLSKASADMFTIIEPFLEGDAKRRFRKVTEAVNAATGLAKSVTSFTVTSITTDIDTLLGAGSFLSDAVFASYAAYDSTTTAADAATKWDTIREKTKAQWDEIKVALLAELKPIVTKKLEGKCAEETTDPGVPLFPTSDEKNTFLKNGQPLNKDLTSNQSFRVLPGLGQSAVPKKKST